MAAWRFMHQGSACIMIGFRSDHACIMHKSETDWMHARGQPASARAWPQPPAGSWQLAGWRVDFWGTQSRHDMDPIAAAVRYDLGMGPCRQRRRRGVWLPPEHLGALSF